MSHHFFRNTRLRNKLIFVVMVSTTAALLLAGAAIVIIDRISYQEELVQNLETLTEMIGTNCSAALLFLSRADADLTMAALRAEPNILSAYVIDSSGALFANYYADSSSSTPFPTLDSTGLIVTASTVTFAQPIVLDGVRIGTIILQSSRDKFYDRTRRNVFVVIIVMLVAILSAFAIVTRLHGIVTDPILHLTHIAEKVARDRDYSLRAEKPGNDETGFLTGTFNDMLAQIELRDAQLREAQRGLEERVRQRTISLEREVTERTRVEQMVRASLAEKEVLLKEIHHRVKNNLQIITSLLNLQAGKTTDAKLREMFHDSQNRVKSMALIHEKLYRSDNLSEINLSDYVQSLCGFLMSSVSGNYERIRMVQDVDDVRLGVDKAIPCGLIINELVTNSLKYAFPSDTTGVITITGRKLGDDQLSLAVGDTGVGLPDGFELTRTNTLGMQLVHSLVSQLEGTLQCDNATGTHFTITFGYTSAKRTATEYKHAAI